MLHGDRTKGCGAAPHFLASPICTRSVDRADAELQARCVADCFCLPSRLSRAAGVKAGLPGMALLRTFFQRWQLRHAGADASDEALQADLHAPVVCVVPAREVEDAAEARSASGSSHDHAKTNSALLQPSEVAMLADEILQLSKATAPRGATRSAFRAYC